MNLGATRTPRILLQWHGFKTIVSPRIFHRTSQLAYGENSSRLNITVASSSCPQCSKRPGILNYSSTRTIRTSSWTRTGSNLNDAFSEDNKDRFVTQLGRMRTRRSLIASCSEEAGVFVPFCYVNSVPSVLFTLRSNQLNKHRGEVSFPGGKKDPEDKSVVETAVREMEEELGLDKSCVQVWANMPARPDRLGKIAITPVIGFIGEIDINTLELNPEEVESVFTLSLEHICNPINQGYTKFTSQAVLPLFLNGPHRIWGLTAIILEQVLLAVVPEHYPKQIHRPGNRKVPVYTRKKETNK